MAKNRFFFFFFLVIKEFLNFLVAYFLCLASVGESGESAQHGSANIGESGESAQHNKQA